MKILIATDTFLEINGVSTTLSNTEKILKELGNDVLVLYPQLWKTFGFNFYKSVFIPLGSDISKKIKEFSPDAIHIATEGIIGLKTRRWCMKNYRGFTTAYHTDWPNYLKINFHIPPTITRLYLRWFHHMSDTVMVATESCKVDLAKNGINHVSMWGRGVDRDVFYPLENSPSSTKPIYLYVGRIELEKNLEAFLSLDLPGEKIVVGGGNMLATYKIKYPSVEFTGPLRDHALANIYKHATVFVFPSITDTYGLVMIEAIACGVPVAAYPVIGPRDIIVEGKSGSMNSDLLTAIQNAEKIPKSFVIKESEKFTWENATKQFIENLYAPHIDK